NKELFDKLSSHADEIHEELGFEMEWKRLDNRKVSRIIYYIKGLDFENHDNYNDLIDEVINKVIILRDVVKKYI
ncbi:TPA: DUF4268 domain-containing protein, partial [Streptococcus suis]